MGRGGGGAFKDPAFFHRLPKSDSCYISANYIILASTFLLPFPKKSNLFVVPNVHVWFYGLGDGYA